MARILIIAYGNPLRCDDGIAWRAAQALEGKFRESQVEILRLHQLAPEVADDLAGRDLAVLLDAACGNDLNHSCPGEIRLRELSAEDLSQNSPGALTHVYSPAKVLDLARELYNATPKAFVITVTGQNFGHGEFLSPPVASAVPELIAMIERVVQETLRETADMKGRT